MTVNILEREIDGLVLDVHGVLYDHKDQDKIFAPLQSRLAQLLLSGEKDSPEGLYSKRQEYIRLALQIGSWRRAFTTLGGNELDYLRAIGSIDWTEKFTRNQELVNLLEQLNLTVALGILSGGLISMAEPICSQILGDNWRRLFRVAVFDDTPNLSAKKPDRKSFLYTLQLMKVEPSRAAVIDNSSFAVASATALGMLTVFVGEENGIGDLRLSRIEDLKTLIDLSNHSND